MRSSVSEDCSIDRSQKFWPGPTRPNDTWALIYQELLMKFFIDFDLYSKKTSKNGKKIVFRNFHHFPLTFSKSLFWTKLYISKFCITEMLLELETSQEFLSYKQKTENEDGVSVGFLRTIHRRYSHQKLIDINLKMFQQLC